MDSPGPQGGTLRWSACYAPHASMYFDQFGKVRACCQNTGVYLGDVTTQTLREIWESAEAEQMRTALEHDDYSAGCEFCQWQVREGNEEIVFARKFDGLRPEQKRIRWPRQMEFSLTNTCNLACVMCNGDWSSTIRAKREGRAPIPVVYGDAFYEQLAEFLPHLEEVAFLGGEPFLGREPLRVMEMLAALEHPPRVTITTNGTVFTDRVKRIIEALRPNIVVSIDGASTATYDAIRIGAHFPDVIANLDRFRDAVGIGLVSITHCLMTTNWHEFADLLNLAEDRDLVVGANVVRFPEELSLYHLDPDRLAHVVDRLLATPVALTASRLDAWTGHTTALAHRLEMISADHPELGPLHGLPGLAPWTAPTQLTSDTADEVLTSLRAATPGGGIEVEISAGEICSVQAPAWSDWLAPSEWIGVAERDLGSTIERHVGGRIQPEPLEPPAHGTMSFLLSIDAAGVRREVEATRWTTDGRTQIFVRPRPNAAAAVPS